MIGGGPGGYVAALDAGMRGGASRRDRAGPPAGRHLPAARLHPLEDDGQDRRDPGRVHRAADFGITATPRPTGTGIVARKDKVVDGLTKGINDLFKARKITRLEGKGRLLTPRSIFVQGTERV